MGGVLRVWGESRCCVSDVSVGGVCCRCVSYGCVSKGVWRCGLLLWMRRACRYFESSREEKWV